MDNLLSGYEIKIKMEQEITLPAYTGHSISGLQNRFRKRIVMCISWLPC